MSLAIFMRLAARVASVPLVKTISSWLASAANLLGADTNGKTGEVGDACGDRLGEAFRCVEPGADRGAAGRQFVQARQGRLDPRDVGIELRDVAAELLAERERDGVLQVRAPDLDDVGELLRPSRERVTQGTGRWGSGVAMIAVAAAMCIAVGNVSLDDCDMFTWSLGCTGDFEPITPPGISIARFEMTSLTFMLVWVPEPVCHVYRGKWSSSSPAITSSAAATIRSAMPGSRSPASRFTMAAAFFRIAWACTTSIGMRSASSSPIAKCCRDRCVCAPQ